MQEDGQMEHFVRVMKALSDPNRVMILKMLLEHKMMCVCEMQAALQLAQPTVSKHLKILLDAGLISCKRDGLWMNYSPCDGDDSPYVSIMLRNLIHWLQDDPRVGKIMEKLPSIKRENICNKFYA